MGDLVVEIDVKAEGAKIVADYFRSGQEDGLGGYIRTLEEVVEGLGEGGVKEALSDLRVDVYKNEEEIYFRFMDIDNEVMKRVVEMTHEEFDGKRDVRVFVREREMAANIYTDTDPEDVPELM